MTRSFFLDNITEWCELIEFCNDEGLDTLSDVVDDDDMDRQVSSDAYEYLRNDNSNDWRWLRDKLEEVTTGYGYYRVDGTFDYTGLSDADFNDYKRDVLDIMDEGGYWDEEDEENDTSSDDGEEEPTVTDEPPVPEEEFSVSDLIGMAAEFFSSLAENAAAIEKEMSESVPLF